MEENILVDIFWSADGEGLTPSAFHFTIWHWLEQNVLRELEEVAFT